MNTPYTQKLLPLYYYYTTTADVDLLAVETGLLMTLEVLVGFFSAVVFLGFFAFIGLTGLSVRGSGD